MTTTTRIQELARLIDQAQVSGTELTSLDGSEEYGKIDVETAYAVQEETVRSRLQRGETITGVKLGFTSKEKMAQMNVSNVIVGRVFDSMEIENGGATDLSHYIHPKVEPEVAYRLSRDVDLDDPEIDLVEYVDAIAPAVEVIDSRYRDFKFTYADVIADNTSAAGYVLGQWQAFRPAPDNHVTITTQEKQVEGTTAAILDDPENALHELLVMCRRHRIPLKAGYVILAGAATSAIPFTGGVVTCEVAELGKVSLEGVRK